MELIYLYIEKFEDTMIKQEINFSPNFDVKIENKKLIIDNKVSHISNLYPKNIKNINILLGKNGAGKTTILDILGMNSDDRCKNSIKRKWKGRDKIVDSYLILYHIEGDYYGFEVVDDMDMEWKDNKNNITNLFKNTITNFDFDKNKDVLSKIPVGFVAKKEKNKFQVANSFFKDYTLGYKVSDKILVNYILKNDSDHSERIHIKYNLAGKDEENYEDEVYSYKRRYYINATKVMQYRYINDLNKDNNNNLDFIAKSAAIEIKPKFDYDLGFKFKDEDKKEMKKWIEQLEKNLYIDKSGRLDILKLGDENQEDEEIKKDSNKEYKDVFMLDLLSSNIINCFIKGVCGIIEDFRTEEKENDKEKLIDLTNKDYIRLLNKFKKLEKNVPADSQDLLGSLVSKKKEYENLKRVINFYEEDKNLKTYDKLIYISRYLNSRIESSNKIGSESRYEIALEEFFNGLNLLKESYFNKENKSVYIKCNSDIDEQVVSLLKVYDKYWNNEYNGLHSLFKVKFKNLSEGQYNFIHLFSKIFDIVNHSNDDKLTIILLDEPDQSLHPEWSRQFIEVLSKEIEKYKNKNVQIILSTHSPFLISDLLKDNIILLKKEKNGQSIVCDKDKFKQTFGSNIHTLLSDSFFMDNTMGEFANEKIKNVVKDLTEKSAQEILKIDGRKEEIQYIIDSIGEPLIKRKIENMYNKKFQYFEIDNKVESLSNRIKQLENIIKENGFK